MRSRHYLSLMLLLSILLISCASTTEPSFVVDGDVASWDWELSTTCYWPFPGILAGQLIQKNHARAKIELNEKFSESFTGRSMDEGGWPSGSSNCSVYDPPPDWTQDNYVDEDLNKIALLINEKTNMESPNQRIRFLVYAHRSWENFNFGQNDEIVSGGERPFVIQHMNNAIRNVAVVFVDDLHRYHCLNNKSYEWLTEEIMLTALHEMGHVSTDEDSTAHTNHSGDYNACCALRSPAPDDSDCRTTPGYCEQHIRAIANRRFNNEFR